MKNKERIVWLLTLACIMACIFWSGGPATSVAFADGNGGEPAPIMPPPDSGDSVILLPDQADELEESTIDVLRKFLEELF